MTMDGVHNKTAQQKRETMTDAKGKGLTYRSGKKRRREEWLEAFGKMNF